jgi:hypothetical protein
MFNIYLQSFFLGSLLGFLYGSLFFKKYKKLFNHNSSYNDKKPDFFKFSFISILTFILLISIFVLVIFKFNFNLPIIFISFLLFFWVIILKSLNTVGRNK